MLLGLCVGLGLNAQTQRYWVFLSDKGTEASQWLSNPRTFLSADALTLKAEKGLTIDESDVPVSQAYRSVLAANSQKVLYASRWLNAVAVEVNPSQLAAIQALPFTQGVTPVQTMKVSRFNAPKSEVTEEAAYGSEKEPGDVFDYGKARVQAAMLGVPEYHAKGITGRGVKVAVFDAGFENVNKINVFDSLWAQKRIVAWHDFVDGDEDVFDSDSHGTNVLSCIAANLPGKMVGIAPHATFYLARTEQSKSETNREEYNWVAAMEWADSIGVDVIHSSLGYSKFDDGVGSYTYKDMDGNTAICTKAADRAAKKGIIVTVSAGNEGGDAWKYITAPSDADSVLCVGAVNAKGKRTYFSSMGPSSDGQVKPDVMAMGGNTTVATPDNTISTSDGTSFSGPIMAGFEILLKSAHPKRSNMDIIQATRLSGDQYNFPDGEYGYGIPNILVADSLLKNVKDLSKVTMPGTEKPVRGDKPKPKAEAAALTFATNPKSKITATLSQIVVEAPAGGSLKSVEVKYGGQTIFLPASMMSISPSKITLNATYLMKGEHYLHIVGDNYEENVKLMRN